MLRKRVKEDDNDNKNARDLSQPLCRSVITGGRDSHKTAHYAMLPVTRGQGVTSPASDQVEGQPTLDLKAGMTGL